MKTEINYKITSLKDNPELFDKQDNIVKEAWPEFMLHDHTANKYWMELEECEFTMQPNLIMTRIMCIF